MHAIYQQNKSKTRLETRWQTARKGWIPNHQYFKASIPAPSKGWCLNPKGLLNGTPYHQFGTPWRVQVCIYHIYIYIYVNTTHKIQVLAPLRNFGQKKAICNLQLTEKNP